MKKTVDALDSTTGWTNDGIGTITALSVNQIPDYIAGINTGSLVISIPSGNNGNYIKKLVTFNPAGYTEIVFHIWSRNKANEGLDYKLSNEFAYKITFDDKNEFYVPTFNGFKDVGIYIKGLSVVTEIKITALHNDNDYIIISNMVAVRDEIPVDIYDGVKEQLIYELNRVYPQYDDGVANKGLLIGTITGTAGDDFIYNAAGFNWLDKYAVIKIDDGSNSEIHQIIETDQEQFKFNSEYDGAALLHSYTSANIYITIPVEKQMAEKDIILPGISISGMSPEETLRTSKIEEKRDTFNVNETVKSRLTPVLFSYIILLDIEARQDELLALGSLACRSMIGKQFCWINGRKINIFPEGLPVYLPAIQGYNEIPKLQYSMRIELKEDIFDRQSLVRTITNNDTFNLL
jgi:hypothetical protein